MCVCVGGGERSVCVSEREKSACGGGGGREMCVYMCE